MPTKRRPLTGTTTALVTPFRGAAVAYDDLKKLVDWQIRQGIDAVSPAGTTGESPTLSHDEHIEVVRAVVEAARGRVPVIAGTGSNSTQEAVDLTRRAHDAGADAMLVVAPYYNKPAPEGLFRHFAAVAEATDRPIVLYSIPSRCGIEISVPVVERLRAKYRHVAWIKESGGSVDKVDQLKSALGDAITVLSGDDSLALPFLAVGAEGVISVASNYAVKAVSRMVRAARENDLAAASRLHRRLYPFFKAIFVEPNPVPIKAVLAHRGIISSAAVRLPLAPLSAANRALVERVTAELG